MNWNVLIVLGCLVGGYVVVSMLINSGPRDPRQPQREDPPSARPAGTRAPRLPAPRQDDWTLLLDIPRSASARDIEAAFRRQQGKAMAAGDSLLLENLRRARDAALAEQQRD